MNREHYLSKRLQSLAETDQQVEPESKEARATQAALSVNSVEKHPTKKKAAGSGKTEAPINR